jgi:hypothetical protein
MAHGPISNEVLLAKIESSYGVDPTPVAGTNAILFRDLEIVPFDQLRMFDREAVRGSLGTLQHVYGGSLGGIRFGAEIKGSGAAGTAPEIGPLLRACGMGETVVASTSVTYAPVSTSLESVTIYAFEFGRVRHIFSGCRGNVTLRFPVGEAPMARFEFLGKRGTVTDQSQPTPTINSTVPQAVKGLAATIGGVGSLVVQEFELAVNNRIVAPGNLNDSEGYGNVTVLKRDPTLSMLLHAELIATLNPFSDLGAGTARAIVSGTLGSTAGNRVALSCPQAHYRGVEPGEADGFRNRRHMFGCHESATADTDFSLAFT